MNVVFRLAKVLLNSGIATIVNGLSGLALSFLYVRFVGLDVFGQMSLILMVATLVFNFASIGILSGVTRILTEHLPKEKERSSFVLSVFIVTFILITVFSFPTFVLVSHFYDLSYGDGKLAFYYLVITTLVYMPFMLGVSIFESIQDLSDVLRANILINVIKVVAFIILVNGVISIEKALAAFFMLPNLGGLIFLYCRLVKRNLFTFKNPKISDNISVLKILFSYSLRAFPLSFSEIIISNVPYIYLNSNATYSVIGLFRFLHNLIRIGFMFPQFLSKALVPFFTKLLMKKHLNIMEKYFKMFTHLFFLLFFLISSTIILTKVFWFSLLDSDIQLSWFSLLTLALSIYLLGGSFIGSLYSAIDKPHISSISSLFSALIASICLFKLDLGMSIIENGLLFYLISYGLNQLFLFGLLGIGFGYKLDFRKNIAELVFLVVLGYFVSENFCGATRDKFFSVLVCLGILVSYIIILSRLNVLDRFTQKEYRKFIAMMRR